MSDQRPTFTFENGQVYAILGNQVIASGSEANLDDVENDAEAYLDSLNTEKEAKIEADRRRTATHIITPNGVKGKILGQTPTLWGDEITVRFENNHVSKFDVHGEENFEWVTENHKTASTSDPIDQLESRLSADYDVDRDSLIVRARDLNDIARLARKIALNDTSVESHQRISGIHTAAEAEISEIRQAVDHMDAQKNEDNPFVPFESRVARQADLGTTKSSSWLDITANEMIAESENQDFDQILSEGPGVFTADLDDSVISHMGSVSQMARDYVISKTAGFEGSEVDEFREAFVARTEVARRHELASRKAEEKLSVTAATEESKDFPDEALFGI